MKLWFNQSHPKQSPQTGTGPIRPWRCDQAWWLTMGFAGGPPASLDVVEKRFRRLAALAHPDRGGSDSQMQALVRARARARQQYRHA